jgi:putative ATPase
MKPLAEILRPQNLDDFFGQSELLNNNHPLKQAIVNNKLHSMILWGPPGTGKTTLARIIASQVNGYFAYMNTALEGIKEFRIIIEKAKKFQTSGQQTVLFIDEIHGFNKTQQDAFLPYMESGLITVIGATTQNPSFEINGALLSRFSIYVLNSLSVLELEKILDKALDYKNIKIKDKNIKLQIINTSNGDARRLINIVEQIALVNLKVVSLANIKKILQEKLSVFDKGGDIFYQQLSAFHKSVRGSSPDGALYWMARMLLGGCDIKVIARRLLAIASEDIGNADPRALEITLNAWDIFERVGAKEGNRAIAQAAVYCAVAPKSNAVYNAFNKAMEDAKKTSHLSVPKHLCNAPTDLMKNLDYGKGYIYSHNEPNALAKGQKYFPDELSEQQYYLPTNRGLEIKIAEKLKILRQKK